MRLIQIMFVEIYFAMWDAVMEIMDVYLIELSIVWIFIFALFIAAKVLEKRLSLNDCNISFGIHISLFSNSKLDFKLEFKSEKI